MDSSSLACADIITNPSVLDDLKLGPLNPGNLDWAGIEETKEEEDDKDESLADEKPGEAEAWRNVAHLTTIAILAYPVSESKEGIIIIPRDEQK